MLTASGVPTTTVLVADGQRLLAEALSRTLQGYPDLRTVGTVAPNGEAAIKAIERERPDVALVDYWMPGLDGPAVTRAVARSTPATKVLLMSWAHGPDHVQEALAAGAVGFLPKSLTVDQLVQAVRQAQDGHGLVYAEQLATLVEYLNGRLDDAERKGAALATLTARELEILALLCTRSSSEQLLPELGITAGTLKNHIHKILAKTGANTRLEAIEIARWAGLAGRRPPNVPPRSH